MSKTYEVKGITKAELRNAIDKNTLWKNDLAVIPKSKAIWLVSNNRIEEDDYCGVIGFENERIISFIFMLPDLLNTKNGKKKVYWLLLWWVDSKFENTVFATYTFNEAITLAGKQVLIKAYEENVNRFYEKQPFQVIASRLRHTIFFSIDKSVLIARYNFLKPLSYLIKLIDNFSYTLLKLINFKKSQKSTRHIIYEYIHVIDNQTWEYIKPLCKNDLIFKTKEYINWQICNSQYTQTPVGKNTYNALLSGISNNIHIHNLKIIKEAEIIGFLSYTLNYNECNVKYFLVSDRENYNTCVDVLIENLYASKSKYIFTDDLQLRETINKRYKTIFTHNTLKRGLAHKSINLDMQKENLNLYNRDGHFY